jgi:hypothetical protein
MDNKIASKKSAPNPLPYEYMWPMTSNWVGSTNVVGLSQNLVLLTWMSYKVIFLCLALTWLTNFILVPLRTIIGYSHSTDFAIFGIYM